jgi:hypothetical protein
LGEIGEWRDDRTQRRDQTNSGSQPAACKADPWAAWHLWTSGATIREDEARAT